MLTQYYLQFKKEARLFCLVQIYLDRSIVSPKNKKNKDRLEILLNEDAFCDEDTRKKIINCYSDFEKKSSHSNFKTTNKRSFGCAVIVIDTSTQKAIEEEKLKLYQDQQASNIKKYLSCDYDILDSIRVLEEHLGLSLPPIIR